MRSQAIGAKQTERSWEQLEQLYRSSRDDVYAYVVTLLRDRAAAEDATALAFERAFRRRSTFDRRRGAPRPWLFAIACNAALDELRRRRRSLALEAELEHSQRSTSPATAAAAGADDEVLLRRSAVRAALDALSARERELIALKFHAGLSNAELAQVLGVSVSNAGTLLHRTLQKLRKAVNAPV